MSITDTKTFLSTGERLDKELLVLDISRSKCAKIIEKGQVKVQDQIVQKPSFKTKEGQTIQVTFIEEEDISKKEMDIYLKVLYEDDDMAVVEKPVGMVVHPSEGYNGPTLVNALLYLFKTLSTVGGENRQGIVHRLDKDTSGLILVAKNDEMHLLLKEQFEKREVEKHYTAIVYGKIKEKSGEIHAPIKRSEKERKKMAVSSAGKEALTYFTVLEEYGNATRLDVQIVTGRTHQIRVHMAYIGHPVLGDVLYGYKKMPNKKRLMLHASALSFVHPITKQKMHFTSDAPF